MRLELLHVKIGPCQQLGIELVHLELNCDEVFDLFGLLELCVLGAHCQQHRLELRQLRRYSCLFSLQVIVELIGDIELPPDVFYLSL